MAVLMKPVIVDNGNPEADTIVAKGDTCLTPLTLNNVVIDALHRLY